MGAWRASRSHGDGNTVFRYYEIFCFSVKHIERPFLRFPFTIEIINCINAWFHPEQSFYHVIQHSNT
jgi:hypothetical protein